MFLFLECTILFAKSFYDWNVFGAYWNVIGFPNWDVEGLLLSNMSGLMRHKKHKHLKSIQKSIAELHVAILGQGHDISPDKHLKP